MRLSRRALLKQGVVAVPLLPFMISERDRAQAETTSPHEQWYWYPGHSLCIKAAGKDTANTCMWMLVENSPREGVPFHKHLNEDELFYVLDGLFEITVGDKTVTGGPGTCIYGPRSVPHRWTNIGSNRGRMLNVFTPAGLENYFLAVAVPIATPSEQPCVDMTQLAGRMAALRDKFGLIRTGERKYPSDVEKVRCAV